MRPPRDGANRRATAVLDSRPSASFPPPDDDAGAGGHGPGPGGLVAGAARARKRALGGARAGFSTMSGESTWGPTGGLHRGDPAVEARQAGYSPGRTLYARLSATSPKSA